MEQDRFKWYSSYSDDFKKMALSEYFLNYLKNMFDNEYGINSFLYVFIDCRRDGWFRIFFSTDGTLYEMENLLSHTIEGINVRNVMIGEIVKDATLEGAKYFISQTVLGENMGNIVPQIRQCKHVALVQVAFDDEKITPDSVTEKLRELFKSFI